MVGEIVRVVEQAPRHAVIAIKVRVLAVLLRRQAENGEIGPAGFVQPRHRLATGGETGLYMLDLRSLEEAVPHVVIARPQELYRFARGLGDFHGFYNVVDLQPPAKAAAQHGHVHLHSFCRDAEQLRCFLL